MGETFENQIGLGCCRVSLVIRKTPPPARKKVRGPSAQIARPLAIHLGLELELELWLGLERGWGEMAFAGVEAGKNWGLGFELEEGLWLKLGRVRAGAGTGIWKIWG